MIIRKATVSDLDWIIEELGEFSKEFKSKISIKGSDEYCRKTLIEIINNHVFFISEDKAGVRTGLISGVLIKLFWWVKKEFRNTRSGLMLLNKFISFGKENVDWTLISTEIDSPVSDKCLVKRGFRLQEKNYIMEN